MAPKTRQLWRESSAPRPMLSTPPTSQSTPCPTSSSSSSSKLILLSEWWLIKSESDVDGKRLAVGGYHYSCEETAPHIFTSAPIVMRFDAYTLETADGITIILQGGINESRMQHNGFPPEVSYCFFTGFPYNWEYYAKKDFGPVILNSAAFPTSANNSNEGIFPIHVAGEFPLLKLIRECASNAEPSLDTFDPVNSTDDVSNALSPEDSKSLRIQREDNSGNKDPEFITRKMSSTLEASFESPQACAQRNTDTESIPHPGNVVRSTTLSPFASSLLRQMRMRKLGGSKLNMQNRAKRIRVNLPNDDSDVVDSSFNENTGILSLNRKESKEKDTKTVSTNASPIGNDNSNPDLGRAQCCYMLRSRDAKIEYHSQNSVKHLKSKPLNLPKLDNTESQNAACVGNLATLMNNSTGKLTDSSSTPVVVDSSINENTSILYLNGEESNENDTKTLSTNSSPVGEALMEPVACNSSHNTGGRVTSTNLKDKCEGGQILESVKEVECEGTYIADDANKHANDLGDIGQCINKISTIHEDIHISTNLEDKREGGQILVSALEVECERTYIADDADKHTNNIGDIKQCANKIITIHDDVHISQTKDFSECGSHYSEMHSGTWIENQDDIKGTAKSEEIKGIASNQDENHTEAIQEDQVNKVKPKKARNQKRDQRPNICEEMKSPSNCGEIEKQNATSPTSPELLNPKRSRSGRLLIPPINYWQRRINYDMDGSITSVADVDKLTSITESKPKKSGRRK